MHLTAIFVMTVNGKITAGVHDDRQGWVSAEDAVFFRRIKRGFPVRIMGRKTYETVRGGFDPVDRALRIVMTSHPMRYNSHVQPGRIEFTSLAPGAIVQMLENRGFSKALIAGGAETFTSFLSERLIDDLYLTVEPFLAGTGVPLVTRKLDMESLRLLTVKRLNGKGTAVFHYERT